MYEALIVMIALSVPLLLAAEEIAHRVSEAGGRRARVTEAARKTAAKPARVPARQGV